MQRTTNSRWFCRGLRSLVIVSSMLVAAGCSSDREPAGPGQGPAPELVGSAIRLHVDLKAGQVTVAPPPASTVAMTRDGLAPSFALMGQNEIGVATSNFFRSAVGEFTPFRVRVRFDLAITNKLLNADLVPSTFPAPPSGVAEVIAFPFATDPSGLFGLKVRASTDWNGTGAAGSGAPHNFFNDAVCVSLTPPGDCFRWEAFGAAIEAGATTEARTVGFDVDPTVQAFTVYIVVAADVRERPSIALSSLSVGFAALAGGQDPPVQDIQVTSSNSAVVTALSTDVAYTGEVIGWLGTALSATTTPATLTLEATIRGLEPGTYTASVSVTAPDAANSPQTVNVTLAVGDGSAPSVVTTQPADASIGVARAAVIQAHFSEPLDPATVNTESFTLASSAGMVAGTVSASGTTATFTPAAPLSAGRQYTATLSTGIADLAGNHLSTAFAWTFRANVPPASFAGADRDVARATQVVLDGQGADPDGQTLTFTWAQASGPSVALRPGARQSFLAPNDVVTLELDLVVSDGVEQSAPDRIVLWVLDNAPAFWVSPTGNDANPGTRAAPKATIPAAINRAAANIPRGTVYAAAGTYTGFALSADVSVYGGFHPTTFLRDIMANPTVISGGPTGVFGNGASSLTLDGLTIRSASASTLASSIGLLLVNSPDVVVSRNTIVAGSGGIGVAGADGASGLSGWAGSAGHSGGECFLLPGPTLGRPGGVGGQGVGFAGGDGGRGTSNVGQRGFDGSGGGGGFGGTGGAAGTGAGGFGQQGAPGAAGSDGLPSASFGSVSSFGYTSPTGGQGGSGEGGSGGGGGGGGGGSTNFFTGVSVCGGGGGGGGSGGGGGGGGLAGRGGGGSFGVLLVSGSTNVAVTNNSITTGSGGQGAAGGAGGAGGVGGAVGSGGSGTTNSGPGGAGGEGGPGGRGGAGGGGRGGPSIGIVVDATSETTIVPVDGNTFILGSAGPGAPGAGAGLRVAYLKLF